MSTPTVSIYDLVFGNRAGQAAAAQREALLQAQAAEAQALTPPAGATGATGARGPTGATGATGVVQSTVAVGGARPVLTQAPTPAALTAIYQGVRAGALVQRLFVNAPTLVPPAGTATYTYRVPTGQVLVLLQPLTASSDLESPQVSATMTVDNVVLFSDLPLTRSAGVLLAAEAVVEATVQVTYTNADWDAEEVTTNIVGWLLDAARYASEVTPILERVYQSVAARVSGGRA